MRLFDGLRGVLLTTTTTDDRAIQRATRRVLHRITWCLFVGAALVGPMGVLSGCDTLGREHAMTHDTRPDFDALWDYNNPDETATQFKAVLESARAQSDDAYRAELLTQFARTQSLQRAFEDAHATLDQAETIATSSMHRAQIRLQLERGRTYNSSKQLEKATLCFQEAWSLAQSHGYDGLAVDAAHMLAIVDATPGAVEWNQQALILAESSDDADARRWIASLCNNLGWTHHDAGAYETALAYFERALRERREAGDASDIRVAQWCVARCLRSLQRPDEAFVIQEQLAETMPADAPDGYIFEEMGECLLAMDRSDEARPWFARAFETLGADAWFVESEPERLQRCRELGGVD